MPPSNTIGKPIGEIYLSARGADLDGSMDSHTRREAVEADFRQRLEIDTLARNPRYEPAQLEELLDRHPYDLSGGEQQRVAIARAIVNEPAILLADEPTGNLDPTNSWEIMSLLKEANERGTTVLVVTHNQEIVNEMNERVITMKQGVIVSDERKGGYTDED